MAHAVRHFRFQRVVTAVALGKPEETRSEEWIRPCRSWSPGDVFRALGNCARGSNTTGQTACGIGANLRWNRVLVNAHVTVISVRSHVGDAQRGALIQLLLNAEIPLLNCRRFRVALYSLRGVDRATRVTVGEQEGGLGTPGVTGTTEDS